MERGGAISYYHSDGLGSVVALTDSTGAVVERYTYDVYGTPAITDAGGLPLSTSAVGNPYLFTARRYDPEGGSLRIETDHECPSQDPIDVAQGVFQGAGMDVS